MSIVAKAPTRVDLAGGTLDINPLFRILRNPVTVNIAVDLCAQVEIKRSNDHTFRIKSVDQGVSFEGSFQDVLSSKDLPLVGLVLAGVWDEKYPALELELSALSPKGAGLGGSSCLAVTLVGALDKARQEIVGGELLPPKSLVQIAQDIETALIHVPTGCQDYWGAVNGGLSVIQYPPGSVEVGRIRSSFVEKLSRRMILCFSGQSRDSGINNWDIFKAAFDGDLEILAGLNKLGYFANQLVGAFEAERMDQVLEFSRLEWDIRRELWPNITTDATQKIHQTAVAAGAMFTRVCGAGGGGVMAVFVEEQTMKPVKDALIAAGGQVLDAKVGVPGLAVEGAL